MHRRILYLSAAAWIIVGNYDIVNTFESGPMLPTPLHNLILSGLVTVTVVGVILFAASRLERLPRPHLPRPASTPRATPTTVLLSRLAPPATPSTPGRCTRT